MKKQHKTNAVRILDSLSIRYTLHSYDPDENDLSAIHLAETSGLDIDRIFKTLVLAGDKSGPIVAVIPGAENVSLKKLAASSGNKRVEMIHLKELQPLTGYIRGGCSPVGMKKDFPTYIDESALLYATIYVSAGVRGTQMELAPQDLVNAVKGIICDIV